MNLGAYVTYNGGSVSDKPVTWVVKDSYGDVIATLYGNTSNTGVAAISYQLPWYMNNGNNNNTNVGNFGIWTATAESEVGSNYVYDVMPFMYNYTVDISSISTIATVARETSVTGASTSVPTAQNIIVGLQNVADQSENVWVTYTIMDSMNVPIATGITNQTINAATYSNTTAPNSSTLTVAVGTGSVSFTNVPIQPYAFIWHSNSLHQRVQRKPIDRN